MNILDQAMEIEKEGESLYRQFALEAPDKGMKNIFTWLANQERKHYGIFQKMKEGQQAPVVESVIVRDVKEIFESWKDASVCIDVKTTQADLYRRALALEIKSVSAYEKNAGLVPSPQKEIFLKIAAEEKRHQWIVENIIEYITKPEVWVENAEFSHLDEDYYL